MSGYDGSGIVPPYTQEEMARNRRIVADLTPQQLRDLFAHLRRNVPVCVCQHPLGSHTPATLFYGDSDCFAEGCTCPQFREA